MSVSTVAQSGNTEANILTSDQLGGNYPKSKLGKGNSCFDASFFQFLFSTTERRRPCTLVRYCFLDIAGITGKSRPRQEPLRGTNRFVDTLFLIGASGFRDPRVVNTVMCSTVCPIMCVLLPGSSLPVLQTKS